MPTGTALSRRKKTRPAKAASPRRKDVDFDSPRYLQMLTVLKQFRAVIANLKAHYRGVQEATGVSGTQLWALYAVAVRPGIKVGELARELAVHQSTASNLLDRMVELGHIERRREGADQRVVTLYLTSPGKRIVDKAPKPVIGMLQQALLSLPQEQLSALHGNLDVLIKAIGLKRVTGAATPLSISLDDHKRDA